MQPVLITRDHPATAAYLSARDRLAAAGLLLTGLARDLSDDLIRLSPAEAAGVLEHAGDVEKRFARLRGVIVYQQGLPAGPDPGDGAAAAPYGA